MKKEFYFPEGLAGLPDLKKFSLIPYEEMPPFFILQSLDQEEMGFVLVDPMPFFPEYQLRINQDKVSSIDLDQEADSLVLVVVTPASQVENITANLLAPILLNIKKGLGVQLVLEDSPYSVKHPLHQALQRFAG